MPGIVNFVPVFGQNVEVQRLSNSVGRTLDTVTSREIINGILTQAAVPSGSTSTVVYHRLGRVPNGYIVVTRNANCTVWNGPINNNDNFTLFSSAPVSLSLWVF